MKTRSAFALVALLFIAGRAPAGGVDKAKLRGLAQLPNISIRLGMDISSISGFRFGKNPDHLAEIARLQKQMKRDPSDVERYLLLGRHYSMVAKHEKEAKEAWSKAAAICRQQVREHPDDLSWLIRLGEALIDNNGSKESETLLRRVVKEAPNEWRGWLALAECVKGRAGRAIFGDKPFSFHTTGQRLIIPALMECKPTEEQIAEMHRLWKEARSYYDRAVELAPRDEAKPSLDRWSSNNAYWIIDTGLRTIKGEKVNPYDAALLAPESIVDMRHIARLSPDDPQVIGPAMFCDIMSCVYQNKLETKEDLSSWADYLAVRNRSIVDVLPEESRTFVRWCIEREQQLTKHPDMATAAAAKETLAIWLIMMREIGEQLDVFYPNSSHRKEAKAKALAHLRRAVRLDPSRERAWDLLTMVLSEEKNTEEAIKIARRRIEVKDSVHTRYYLAKV